MALKERAQHSVIDCGNLLHPPQTSTNAAFKSSWDVLTYELTSRYYDVRCVQVTWSEKDGDLTFLHKIDFFLTLHLQKMNEECASLSFSFFFSVFI